MLQFKYSQHKNKYRKFGFFGNKNEIKCSWMVCLRSQSMIVGKSNFKYQQMIKLNFIVNFNIKYQIFSGFSLIYINK